MHPAKHLVLIGSLLAVLAGGLLLACHLLTALHAGGAVHLGAGALLAAMAAGGACALLFQQVAAIGR